MANLAIKGHPTRGNEVIEILEMLGGCNPHNYSADCDSLCFYIGKGTNIIYYDWVNNCYEDEDTLVFTLEEFLWKYPYKVGDKVLYHETKSYITSIKWDNRDRDIVYIVKCKKDLWETPVSYLQPYKEQETKKVSIEFFDKYCKKCGSQRCTAEGEWLEECKHYKEETMDRKYNVEEYLKVWEETEKGLEVVVNDKFELKEDNGKFYIIKKQLQFPKTYGECHKLMVQWKEYDCNPNPELILCESPIHDFCKIIVARNIYWKIVGDQMGLGKPWKPDYTNPDIDLYVIINICNQLEKAKYGYGFQQCILTFPTAEIRDTFFENFKDLIEECKELL